jgi:hypothetical protein
MRKIFFGIVFVLALTRCAFAADAKVTALTEDTAPTTDDLLYTVDSPGGTPASRKATIANVLVDGNLPLDRHLNEISFPSGHQVLTIESTGVTAMVNIRTFDANMGLGTLSPSTKLHVVGGVRFASLTSCDTIDTDSTGVLSCGTDDTGGGGGGGSSEWLDEGTILHPNELGDDVSIGTAGSLGHLTVLGNSDKVQVAVRAHTSQTADIVVVEAQGGTDIWTVGPGGIKTTGDATVTRDLNLTARTSCSVLRTSAGGTVECGNFGDAADLDTNGAVSANAVALGTDTTGNYVATIADDGQTTVTVTGSGSETAAVTLRVIDVVCTDCLGPTEITDSYLLNTGDTGVGSYTIDGNADTIQLTVQGHSTQTSDILVMEKSDGTDVMTGAVGGIKVTGDAWITRNFTLANTPSCDSLDTTANGQVFCGTDDDVPESGDFGNAADLDSTGAINTDAVNVAKLDDGSDTASNDDVVMIDNSDNTQFIYIDVPDCDDTGGQHLNYDTATQAFSCGTSGDGVGGGGGGSAEWSDGGTFIYPNELGDDVLIGTATALGHLTVLGTQDEIQVNVRAMTGQTADIVVVEAQDGTDIWTAGVGGVKVTGDVNITQDVKLDAFAACTLKTTAQGALTCGSDNTGGSSEINIPLYVQTAKLSNFASPAAIDAGQKSWRLLYDDSTNENALWQGIIDDDYGSGTLYIDILYTMTSATSGNVIWTSIVAAVTPGDPDQIDGSQNIFDATNSSTVAVPGSSGGLGTATITLTNADSMAAGDFYMIQVGRNASNGSDTAAGDAEIVGITLRE